jgi:hypothetical protein
MSRPLCALASVGVFAERADKGFESTLLSDTLRSDAPDSLRYKASSELGVPHFSPRGKFMHRLKTGQPSFDQVFRHASLRVVQQESGPRQGLQRLNDRVYQPRRDGGDGGLRLLFRQSKWLLFDPAPPQADDKWPVLPVADICLPVRRLIPNSLPIRRCDHQGSLRL